MEEKLHTTKAYNIYIKTRSLAKRVMSEDKIRTLVLTSKKSKKEKKKIETITTLARP